MSLPSKTFTSKSGQLAYSLYENPSHLVTFYGSLKGVSTDEYLDYLSRIGTCMEEAKTGRIFVDFSNMEYYTLALRAAAVNNLNELILKKVPYFLTALLRSKSMFENLGIQAALGAAKPLSKKFIDGKLFDNKDEALKWLIEYPISTDKS